MVGLAIVSAIERIISYGDDIFTSVVRATSAHHRLLANTPVIVMFMGDDNTIHTRAIVYSTLTKVWGLEQRCRNPRCQAGSLTATFAREPNHAFARVDCRSCKWRSGYHARPEWIKRTPLDYVFWHQFPLPPTTIDFFMLQDSQVAGRQREGA